MESSETQEQARPIRLFVYIGQVEIQKGGIGHAYIDATELENNGKPWTGSMRDAAVLKKPVCSFQRVGGIYKTEVSAERLAEGQLSVYLGSGKKVGEWLAREQVTQWEIADRKTETERRMAAQSKKDAATDPLYDALKAWRSAYWSERTAVGKSAVIGRLIAYVMMGEKV
jgi:hypothetical protein